MEAPPLLPSQLAGRDSGAFLPERRLMAAVLAVALADYQSGRLGWRALAQLQAWFASDDTCWPFSFVNICVALDLEVASTRAGVRACRFGSRVRQS